MSTITLSDFQKLEIRIGTVVSVAKVPDTDKLLKFTFDLGDHQRQIIAGMAPFFPDPSILIGKQMPILTNLELKTFRGLESQGMIMAADTAGTPVLLHPASPIPSGSIVR